MWKNDFRGLVLEIQDLRYFASKQLVGADIVKSSQVLEYSAQTVNVQRYFLLNDSILH